MSSFPPERIVLFVHGATYPSETGFDLALDGFSWMDYIACRGSDVYLVDLRGYGQSTLLLPPYRSPRRHEGTKKSQDKAGVGPVPR